MKNMTPATGVPARSELPDPATCRHPRNPGAPLIPREDWIKEPWSSWTYLHTSEMMPTAPIWRGPGPVRPLPESVQPLGQVMINLEDGKVSVDDFLARSATDGFLVLHRGQIVFERYFNHFAPHTHHLVMSVTKSFTGTLAGILADKGLIDVQRPVTHYLPELEATAYKGATVQQLLDMASGVTFDATPLWNSVWHHQQKPGWPRTYWEAILSLDKSERPHGAAFKYRDIETDVVAFILQRASGRLLADLISDEIWAPMGAERDAYIVVDESGFGTSASGLCATMRDLGRFAQLLVEGGAFAGRHIIPRNWIEETRHGRGWRFGSYEECGQTGYHNFWWIDNSSRGALLAHGYGGQVIYVDPNAELAAVKLSYHLGRPRSEVGSVVMPAIRAALGRN